MSRLETQYVTWRKIDIVCIKWLLRPLAIWGPLLQQSEQALNIIRSDTTYYYVYKERGRDAEQNGTYLTLKGWKDAHFAFMSWGNGAGFSMPSTPNMIKAQNAF